MNFWNYIKTHIAVILLCLPAISNAGLVEFPALDIENNSGGVTLTDTAFEIDATAFRIVYADLTSTDITDQAFTLRSTGSIDSGDVGGDIALFSGTFTVDGGLLSGTFSSLTVGHFGDGAGTFSGDVIFDAGGSLVGSSTSGRIDGTFSTTGVDAKVGAVVPVPAAVWLFGSGLIGLIAVARRKTA